MKNKYGILSDLFDGCQLLIAPGDVADKLTILNIKMEHFQEDEEKCRFVHDEFQRTLVLMDRIVEYYPDLDEAELRNLIRDLEFVNSVQWKAEDRVRTEKSWEAAVHARLCNTHRVKIKNYINELFKYPTETKDYKGTDNEETPGNEEQGL